jgi:hypothetical protein
MAIIIEDIRRVTRKKPKQVRLFGRGIFRVFLSLQKQGFAVFVALLLILIQAQAFVAFEAHIVDVKAVVASIDAPIISPAGGEFADPVSITIDDTDPDATHIFYTITPGTDPGSAPDPVCGDTLGGTKPQGPMDVTPSRVVKAVACDGSATSSHASLITTEIYTSPLPPPPLVAPASLGGDGEVLGADTGDEQVDEQNEEDVQDEQGNEGDQHGDSDIKPPKEPKEPREPRESREPRLPHALNIEGEQGSSGLEIIPPEPPAPPESPAPPEFPAPTPTDTPVLPDIVLPQNS